MAAFPSLEKAFIYGSSAKETYSLGSDIDLTLLGTDLDQKKCSDIEDALGELLLPYTIDLSVYELLGHGGLKQDIDRVGKIFYRKT